MTLYDFILQEQGDFDTYDTVFDVCVTVCEPYEYDEGNKKDYYDIFNDLIMKNVEVDYKKSDYECICKVHIGVTPQYRHSFANGFRHRLP